jgi:hypothetical protein
MKLNNDMQITNFNFLKEPKHMLNMIKDYKKLSNDMKDDKFNYLDIHKQQFIFNNYKTQGKYNSVVIKIEDELMQVISLYLSNHPEKSKLKNKTYNIHF